MGLLRAISSLELVPDACRPKSLVGYDSPKMLNFSAISLSRAYRLSDGIAALVSSAPALQSLISTSAPFSEGNCIFTITYRFIQF